MAGIGVQPRRNVDGDDRTVRLVDGLDAFRGQSSDVARKSRAEDRIDDDVAGANQRRAPRLEPPARSGELVVRTQGVSRQAGGIGNGNDVNPESLRMGDARNHVTVAAIVARPAQDDE